MATESSPNVGYVHPDLTAMLTRYQTIDDCLEGETAIKKGGTDGDAYLIRPGSSLAASSAPANYAADEEGQQSLSDLLYNESADQERFRQYVARAVFYPVTQRTHKGLVGAAFVKPPTVKLPSIMEAIEKDCDGAGIPLVQQAERAAGLLLGKGRFGMLVDYPNLAQPATRQDLISGRVRPTITIYEPESVINWRTVVIDGRRVLALVVIAETKAVSDDGFEETVEERWRVLSLGRELDDAGTGDAKPLYRQQVWKRAGKGSTGYELESDYAPLDGKGKRWTEIPFLFGGAVNNDPDIDLPPIEPLAQMNLAHYRNSADLEEMLYMVGQGTPVVSGLTEDWAKEILKGRIQLGSRGLVPLPQGGSADLLQLAPNQLLLECMDRKERQMVALGAKLAEQRQVQRTATEAEIENASELSVLGTCVHNTEQAYQNAIRWCAAFLGIPEDGIEFAINAEMGLGRLDSQGVAQILAAYDKGLISWPEARDRLRRAGYFEGDDAQAKRDMAKEKQDQDSTQPPVNGAQANTMGGAIQPGEEVQDSTMDGGSTDGQ